MRTILRLLLFFVVMISLSAQEDALSEQRSSLQAQLMTQNLFRSLALQSAFLSVPRELFVPEASRGLAYVDAVIPIERGIFLIKPSDIIRSIEKLALSSADRVLLIGKGTGYTAALISQLVETVYVIERDIQEYNKYIRIFQTEMYENIVLDSSAGVLVHRDDAPFDVIFLHEAQSRIGSQLVEQLGTTGKLLFSLKTKNNFQILSLLEKNGTQITISSVEEVFFP